MKIYLGCDHAAYEEKEKLKAYLEQQGHNVEDVGPFSSDRVNYPDFASEVARKIAFKDPEKERGVLLCGSGVGVAMVANRFAGVRAVQCSSLEEAKLSRNHNNANVFCSGARLNEYSKIQQMIDVWLEAAFEGGRHQERIDLFMNIGEK